MSTAKFLQILEKSFSDVRHRCRLVQRLRRCQLRWQRWRVIAARAVAERARVRGAAEGSQCPTVRSLTCRATHSVRARVQCQHKMLTTHPVDLVCVSI